MLAKTTVLQRKTEWYSFTKLKKKQFLPQSATNLFSKIKTASGGKKPFQREETQTLWTEALGSEKTVKQFPHSSEPRSGLSDKNDIKTQEVQENGFEILL